MQQTKILKLLKEKGAEGEDLLQAAEAEISESGIDDLRRRALAWDKGIKHLASLAGVENIFSDLRYSPIILAPSSPGDWKSALISGLKARLAELDQAIDLMEGLLHEGVAGSNARPKATTNSSRVFLVHGHDEATREKVARFLEKVGLSPVILHEQANAGRTIIEKLEENADVGYAVVLLTADDEGWTRGAGETRPRARQNVVFEAGFLMGRLGRNRVALLYEPEVELPSDMRGLVYIPLKEGGWREALFKELKEAGMNVSRERWP